MTNFIDVPEGEHTLLVEDVNAAVGSQKILVTGDAPVIKYEIELAPQNPFKSGPVQVIIGALVTALLSLSAAYVIHVRSLKAERNYYFAKARSS